MKRSPSGRSAPKIASVLPPSPAAAHAVREQLGERAADGVDDAEPRHAAHRGGAGHHDLGDRSRLREDVDRAEGAGRVRHLDGQRRAHRLVDAGLHERARAVQRAAHHRRRVGQVGRDLVARDRHVRRDRHVADVDAVRAEVVGEGGGAVGPGRDLLPDEPLGVVDQRVHQLGERLRPVPLGERDERALGDRAGGDLRPEVAEGHPRDADVRLDDLEDVLDRLALGVELEPGQADALLEDLGVVAGARARQPAADVAVVRGRAREADQLAVEVDGLEDEDVLQVHAAVEGVVHHEDVARPDPVRRSARAASPSRPGSSRDGTAR